MSSEGGLYKRPFTINVSGIGRVLVLRYIKLCEVPEAKSEEPKASCVLKVDPPRSPPCDRRPSALSPAACPANTPPACPMRTPPGSPGAAMPLMRTQMLESLFSTAKNNGEQMCRRQ
ncbi:DNA-binding phosphoprotein-like protein [Seal parapoxvirus]|uniref:DNA-binding phosphoprotein-like protein n=1 Tax=Seal parapoxvirus TaxID=187984 RepID=A0A1Z4CGC9_9POXV|nr:DNA-binding phosphoprotein-like protein [Seal parapoxvirus]ASF89963.1 DNA-binding phosphoprotein-like protein [Seal parapoxvirus]